MANGNNVLQEVYITVDNELYGEVDGGEERFPYNDEQGEAPLQPVTMYEEFSEVKRIEGNSYESPLAILQERDK